MITDYEEIIIESLAGPVSPGIRLLTVSLWLERLKELRIIYGLRTVFPHRQ